MQVPIRTKVTINRPKKKIARRRSFLSGHFFSILVGLTFAGVFCTGVYVFAVSGPFAPGAVTNPTCAPGESGCIVISPVPYTGATAALNLGSRSFSTTGTGTFGFANQVTLGGSTYAINAAGNVYLGQRTASKSISFCYSPGDCDIGGNVNNGLLIVKIGDSITFTSGPEKNKTAIVTAADTSEISFSPALNPNAGNTFNSYGPSVIIDGSSVLQVNGTASASAFSDGTCSISGGALSAGCDVSATIGGSGVFALNPGTNTIHSAISGNGGSGVNNFFVGEGTGNSNVTGSGDVFIGYESGHSNTTGSNDIYIGTNSAYNLNQNNTLIIDATTDGRSLGHELTYSLINGTFDPAYTRSHTGNQQLSVNGDLNVYGAISVNGVPIANSNVFALNSGNTIYSSNSGYSSSQSNSHNFFAGFQAGISTDTGIQNNFIGKFAGNANTGGSYNNFFGSSAGTNNLTGSNDNFIGFAAGGNNVSGDSNDFFGFYAGSSNTIGSNNNFIGVNSGYSNTSGSNDVYIGTNSAYSLNQSNTLIIDSTVENRGGNDLTQSLLYGTFDPDYTRSHTGNQQLTVNGGFNVFSSNAISNIAVAGENDTIDGAGNFTIENHPIVAGSFSGTFRGKPITDDGDGNLSGDPLVSGSRIVYETGAVYLDATSPGGQVISTNYTYETVLRAFSVSPSGIVSVDGGVSGDSTHVFQVKGTAIADAWDVLPTDVAENYPTKDNTLSAGEIVALDIADSPHVVRANPLNTTSILGIISTKPGMTLGVDKKYADEIKVPIALAGRVPVKVNLDGGPINIGDRISLSITSPGVGMKASVGANTIGIALEAFGGGQSNTEISTTSTACTSDSDCISGQTCISNFCATTTTTTSDETGTILVFVQNQQNNLNPNGTIGNGQVAGVSGSSFLQSIKDSLANFGITIENGVVKIATLAVDNFNVKTARIQEMEAVDSVTGEVYCTWIANGDWQKVKGDCATVGPSVQNVVATSSSSNTLTSPNSTQSAINAAQQAARQAQLTAQQAQQTAQQAQHAAQQARQTAQNAQQTVQESQPQVLDISSVAPISDINVAYGTSLALVGLPTTVTVTMSDTTTQAVIIIWDNGMPVYDSNIAGTYVFSGTLSFSGNTTNTKNFKATVNVVVAPQPEPESLPTEQQPTPEPADVIQQAASALLNGVGELFQWMLVNPVKKILNINFLQKSGAGAVQGASSSIKNIETIPNALSESLKNLFEK